VILSLVLAFANSYQSVKLPQLKITTAKGALSGFQADVAHSRLGEAVNLLRAKSHPIVENPNLSITPIRNLQIEYETTIGSLEALLGITNTDPIVGSLRTHVHIASRRGTVTAWINTPESVALPATTDTADIVTSQLRLTKLDLRFRVTDARIAPENSKLIRGLIESYLSGANRLRLGPAHFQIRFAAPESIAVRLTSHALVRHSSGALTLVSTGASNVRMVESFHAFHCTSQFRLPARAWNFRPGISTYRSTLEELASRIRRQFPNYDVKPVANEGFAVITQFEHLDSNLQPLPGAKRYLFQLSSHPAFDHYENFRIFAIIVTANDVTNNPNLPTIAASDFVPLSQSNTLPDALHGELPTNFKCIVDVYHYRYKGLNSLRLVEAKESVILPAQHIVDSHLWSRSELNHL